MRCMLCNPNGLRAPFRTAAIHGDMDQHTRMETLNAFKAGQHHVLVATDVAARGLDIKSIKSVVNYDAAKDIDTHVHRIGRTGRAGDKEGVAYTLVMPHQSHIAGRNAHIIWTVILLSTLIVHRMSLQRCVIEAEDALLIMAALAFAADLLHMLTMAHQELPSELLALARKDSKFRGGSSGRRGGRGGGSGGAGAGRRRPVGGAGLGFEDTTQSIPNLGVT